MDSPPTIHGDQALDVSAILWCDPETGLVLKQIGESRGQKHLQPLGGRQTIVWSGRRRLRPVAPDGFRVRLALSPTGVSTLLATSPREVLQAIFRDEAVSGRGRPDRRRLRAYLEALLTGPELERSVDELASLDLPMGASPEADRTSQLAARIARDLCGPDVSSQQFSFEALRNLMESAVHSVEVGAGDTAQSASLLGRALVCEDRALFLDKVTAARAVELLSPPETHGNWARFRALSSATQGALLRERRNANLLPLACWHPAVRPEPRAWVLEQVLGAPEAASRLANVEAPHGDVEAQLAAIDEALELAPERGLPLLAQAAFRRLCRLHPDRGAGLASWNGFARLTRWGVGVLLDLALNAAALGAPLERVRGWVGVIGGHLGLEQSELLVDAIAIGGMALPVSPRALDGIAPSVADNSLRTGALSLEKRLRERHPAALERIRRAEARLLDTDHAERYRAEDAVDFVQEARLWATWEPVARVIKKQAHALKEALDGRESAEAKLTDPDHARRVLALHEHESRMAAAQEMREEARRFVGDELADLKARCAETFAEIMTAVQTLSSEEHVTAADVGLVEKRLEALARRWNWSFFGRAWDRVAFDLSRHELSGTGTGEPIVVRVGIAEPSVDGERVVVKCKLIRT